MSEIKNVGYSWMALNTFKCNYMSPLHFKGLKLKHALSANQHASYRLKLGESNSVGHLSIYTVSLCGK